MTIHKASAKQTFLDYASHYDLDDPKIRLKVEHTLSVCDLCVRIADSLSSTPEDTDLAWMMGLLHDIGRFEQVRRYSLVDMFAGNKLVLVTVIHCTDVFFDYNHCVADVVVAVLLVVVCLDWSAV